MNTKMQRCRYWSQRFRNSISVRETLILTLKQWQSKIFWAKNTHLQQNKMRKCLCGRDHCVDCMQVLSRWMASLELFPQRESGTNPPFKILLVSGTVAFEKHWKTGIKKIEFQPGNKQSLRRLTNTETLGHKINKKNVIVKNFHIYFWTRFIIVNTFFDP